MDRLRYGFKKITRERIIKALKITFMINAQHGFKPNFNVPQQIRNEQK